MKILMTVVAILAISASAMAQESGTGEGDENKRKVIDKLNSMRCSLDFTNQPLDDVVSYLRDFSGLNIHIDNDVRSKFNDDQLKITIKVKDLLLKSALKLVLSGKDLGATYKEGILLITTKEKSTSAVKTLVYDVRDLLFKVADFPGPRVELASPSGGGTPLTGATFSLDEGQASPISEEFITELIKTNTGDKTWEENSNASVTLANGLLVVTQSAKVHGEVRRMLDLLRQFK